MLAPMNDPANASDVNVFWSAKTRPCSASGTAARAAAVVDEREAVAEAAEREHGEHEPQVRGERAEQQIDGHAA